jgi:hypothetical protein
MVGGGSGVRPGRGAQSSQRGGPLGPARHSGGADRRDRPASRHGTDGVRLHRSRSLDARDTTHRDGIPITTIPKTLVDLAGTVRSDRLERALAQAQRLQLYDHGAVQSLIARSNGHRGRTALAQATSHEVPTWRRSDFEAGS